MTSATRTRASAWTAAHRAWLSKVDLGERGAQATLLDYLGAIDALVIRRDSLEETIGELVPLSPWAEPVARLRCLRGIDTLSAVGLCAEVGDFARFESPAKLMHYLGLVPSENSSGQTTTTRRDHQDRAPGTPAGCSSRRPGTTAARPARAPRSSAAKKTSPRQTIAISWKAQQRLHHIWQRLDTQRGKRKTLVAVAVARHLAGFCWAITNTDPNA